MKLNRIFTLIFFGLIYFTTPQARAQTDPDVEHVDGPIESTDRWKNSFVVKGVQFEMYHGGNIKYLAYGSKKYVLVNGIDLEVGKNVRVYFTTTNYGLKKAFEIREKAPAKETKPEAAEEADDKPAIKDDDSTENASTNAPPSKVTSKIDSALATKVSKSTVLITTPHGAGSGFFYEDKGTAWVASNTHVLGGAFNASDLNICDINGEKMEIEPEIKANLNDDVALVKLKTTIAPERFLKSVKEVSVGENIYVFGNAKGDGIICPLEGIVKGMGAYKEVPILEVTAEFVPGCSGGPVVNEKGELVGVTTYIVKPMKMDGKNKDDIFKKSGFTEARRMAVRSFCLDKTEKSDLRILYLHHKATSDRKNLFELYLKMFGASKMASVQSQIMVEAEKSDINLMNSPMFAGVRSSGMLQEYFEAYEDLKKICKLVTDESTMSVKGIEIKRLELDFLDKLKMKKDSIFIDRDFNEGIDKFIELRRGMIEKK